jgi:hypothetical protein
MSQLMTAYYCWQLDGNILEPNAVTDGLSQLETASDSWDPDTSAENCDGKAVAADGSFKWLAIGW